MSELTLGTCSLCQGPVTVPQLWMSTVPPVPSCKRCGAQRKQAHGPVIEMEKPKAELTVRSQPYGLLSTSTLVVTGGDGQTWILPEVQFPRDSSG